MNPLPYNTILLVQDALQHDDNDIAVRQNQIKQVLAHRGPMSVNELYKNFGFSQYKLTMLGIHFFAVSQKTPEMSPYSLEAPEDPNEQMVSVV